MALNSKYVQVKTHDFINQPTKKLPSNAVLQLFQPLKASHTPPDTQVKRKESLTFQGSSDHEDVTSPPTSKQVQMLPISSTPSRSLPKTDGFLPSHPCLLCFLCKPWESSVALRFPLSHLSFIFSSLAVSQPQHRATLSKVSNNQYSAKSNHVFHSAGPSLGVALLPGSSSSHISRQKPVLYSCFLLHAAKLSLA